MGLKRQERVNSVMNYISTDPELIKEENAFAAGMGIMTDMVLASDAFFPFSDSIDVAAEMGVSHIMQTGGSVMDEEVTKTADKYGMCMFLSNIRVFTH